MPLWEGFDEWGHFAVLERTALRGETLVSRYSPVSRRIEASLKLAPVPWALRYLPPPTVTEDTYWRLSREERSSRQGDVGTLPPAWATEDGSGGFTAYEALQPPLYYWIAAPLARWSRNLDLGSQVLLLRWFSLAIASLAIPLAFLVGRSVFRSDSLALGCAAVVAAMPEFAIDVGRVGNECLGIVLFTLLTRLMAEAVRGGINYVRALAIGLALGLGLLTKAYFLTAIPPVILLFAYEVWRARGARLHALSAALATGAVALPMAAWWYVRNLLTTGTLSGLSEAVMLNGKLSDISLVRRAGEIPWTTAVDGVLLSHIWFGGWSGLTIRSWMYHAFYLAIAVAGIGLLRLWRQPAMLALAGVYAAFWMGELYDILLLFLSKGVATSMGWYLYAVVAAEVALTIGGLIAVLPLRWKNRAPLIGVLPFVLLDLYTVHGVSIPYYTGVLVHRSNGALGAIHPFHAGAIRIADILLRLTAYKTTLLSDTSLAVLWTGYLLATVALVPICFLCAAPQPGSIDLPTSAPSSGGGPAPPGPSP